MLQHVLVDSFLIDSLKTATSFGFINIFNMVLELRPWKYHLILESLVFSWGENSLQVIEGLHFRLVVIIQEVAELWSKLAQIWPRHCIWEAPKPLKFLSNHWNSTNFIWEAEKFFCSRRFMYCMDPCSARQKNWPPSLQ